jgi:hypothetical protein
VAPQASRPVKISVTIGDKTYAGDLEAEARISLDFQTLNEELAEHPGKFAWWATLEVLAKTQVEELVTRRDTLHAEMYSQLESDMTEALGKKPTIEAIKSVIVQDPKYATATENLRKATEAERLMTVARQTMQMRKDSLMAVASNLRAEADAGLSSQLKTIRDKVRTARTPKSA